VRTTLATVLVLGAGVPVQTPEPRLHRDVQLLLARETADAALEAILTRGEHRGPGDYLEPVKAHAVRHVVMCPQPKGLPLFAVFVRGLKNNDYREAKGRLILVAADGAIVRCWRGDNVAEGTFEDVNDDGIVDRVDTIDYGVEGGGLVRELYVLPIVADGLAALRVAFDFRPDRQPGGKDGLAWRVQRAGNGKPARIQLGPRDPATGELISVTAEWSWLASRSAWVGPGGGPGHVFVRLPPDGWAGLEEFAAAQRQAAEQKR
jgi:hypothetical protein